MEFKIAPEGIKLRDIDLWGELYEAMERGTVLEARIQGVRTVDEQGDILELVFDNKPGITGFCPAAETGMPQRTPLKDFTGQVITCKIKRIDKKNDAVICSRKAAVEIALNKLINQLKAGETINALIRAVNQERGLFVDIGGGVILRIAADKARLSGGVPLEVQFAVNSIIKVRVESVDRNNKDIVVVPLNTWEKYDFDRGEVLSGRVVLVRDNLAFISIRPGIIGLVNYKKTDTFLPGDQLKLQVNGFDRINHKLHLAVWDPGRVSDKWRERQRRIKNGSAGTNLLAGNEIKTQGGFDRQMETDSAVATLVGEADAMVVESDV